ncbi:MAG: hypothetical protein Q8P67_12245 [archaeon]|nr:hypothetical protein [archaeon]
MTIGRIRTGGVHWTGGAGQSRDNLGSVEHSAERRGDESVDVSSRNQYQFWGRLVAPL